MQAVREKQNWEKSVNGSNVGMTEAINCIQIKEKLDALFNGGSSLEEMHPAIKRILFGHLETYQRCCRSFDVCVSVRPPGRDRIF